MNNYQTKAVRTLIDRPDFELTEAQWRRILNSVALSAASGSITEYLKKGIFHQHGSDDRDIVTMLGQVYRLNLITPVNYWFASENVMVVWTLTGLIGEVAEVAHLILEGLVKGEFDKGKLSKELGDICWYVASLCTKLGFDLDEVMAANIAKLELRYPNGYNSNDSQRRIDTAQEAIDISPNL